MKKGLSLILVALTLQAPLRAGGFLETPDITGLVPSPLPGHVVGKLVPIRWDARTIPVRYAVNTTLDPVPNPLGPAFLALADARAELQASFDAWNVIKTSYMQMVIAGATTNQGTVGFDMVNELTFRTSSGFGAIASSPSVSLIEDVTFLHGEDIDGDGDADVSSAIAAASDVDGDGDIEFPAGFYRAGTILDNDVQFNTKTTNGYRFTIDPLAADTASVSVDLMAIAVHEFGHSLGLSHVLDNQISATDGTGSSMFPFIDTSDPASELAQRTLSSDDIAWASYHYQEGTAHTGPAALQTGDIAFGTVVRDHRGRGPARCAEPGRGRGKRVCDWGKGRRRRGQRLQRDDTGVVRSGFRRNIRGRSGVQHPRWAIPDSRAQGQLRGRR